MAVFPSYSVSQVGGESVKALIQRVRDAAAQPSDLMDAIGNTIAERVRICFTDSQDPWGNAWEPLKWRQGQPLLDRGILRNSITYRATATTVRVGTNLIYAPVHQFGATIRPKPTNPTGLLWFRPRGSDSWIAAKEVTIPARPYMPINAAGKVDLPSDWDSELKDVIGIFLEDAMNATAQ